VSDLDCCPTNIESCREECVIGYSQSFVLSVKLSKDEHEADSDKEESDEIPIESEEGFLYN